MHALSLQFSEVSDPRSGRNQHHLFSMLLGTTLLAALAGIDSFSGIADFVEAHQEALEAYFDFPHGVPSHDTYQRLWDAISPEEFYNNFVSFTQTLATKTPGLVALDGKTIRHSGRTKPLHIVSAWCYNNRLVLAQKKVDGKSNEITAIPEILRLLDLQGRIVTIDAMGAQRAICQQIIDQGGDYLISLKGNQETLHQDVKLFLNDDNFKKDFARFEENDKGHGRLEKRVAWASNAIDWLQKVHQWPGLQSIGMVHSFVEKKGKKPHEETRYYISSLPPDAEKINHAARAHWAIENNLHWALDVVFNEDGACIRNDNAAENMDIVRKWALNALQKIKEKPDQSIKSIMRKNAMSSKKLLDNVKKILHA